MNELEITPPTAFSATAAASAERVTAFLRKVYGWMFVGLGITATVALGVAGSPALVQALIQNKILFYGLMFGELGLVFFLSARVDKLAPATASGLFLLYSALNGVTLSFIFLAFTGSSIATTFLVTAGMFGALALYAGARLPRSWALAVPIGALVLSDAAIDFGTGRAAFTVVRLTIYASFAAIVLAGRLARSKAMPGRLAMLTVGASVFFFLASNFAEWLTDPLYPKTPSGLALCDALDGHRREAIEQLRRVEADHAGDPVARRAAWERARLERRSG